jgi:acetyl-CoA carboxylase biotin carboxyl carrier protein
MSAPVADVSHVLAALREQALALATGARPPARVRVEAGGAAVELVWMESTVPAPAPPARSGTSGLLAPAPAPAPVNGAATPPPGHAVTAPTVGTFYTAPEPGAAPFVAVGETVAAGQQIGIVEAMKLMIPVEADRGGRVAALLVENGEPVEFGQPLLRLVES